MIAGHTKFALDRLLATLAKSFYSTNVSITKGLLTDVYQQEDCVMTLVGCCHSETLGLFTRVLLVPYPFVQKL